MIDWKRVDELRDEIGVSEFQEVVDLFLEEVEALMARLQSNPQPSKFEADLHFLKGCAVNLGFEQFARLCLVGETTSAAGRPETVDLAPIFACYAASKVEFLAGLQSRVAA
ncbi:Hpt domain-containing protein [Tropicimonas sp. IMCC34043]|uniref:Hpt domain-containing protein n=1 Tax=Tropicimonas sp. IMCC34043 TaxID=2248760 RepID=UPI000E2402B5|nr:Hpt domain-containing protein [Tropicimonas sp. IMCC34043]